MKTLLFGLLLSGMAVQLPAQKIMRVDRSLLANSTMLPVKVKGGIMTGAVLKYEFGPYKVIKTKSGRGTAVSQSKLFSKLELTESKYKGNFELLCNGKDTIQANLSFNTQSEAFYENYLVFKKNEITIEPEENPSVTKATNNIMVLFHSSADTAEWRLMYISRLNTDSSVNVSKSGFLTDGNVQIEIVEVKAWKDRREHDIYLTKGFEFYLDGVAVAAIQCPVNTVHKKMAWLRNDLAAPIRNILAAAMLVFVSYNQPVEQ